MTKPFLCVDILGLTGVVATHEGAKVSYGTNIYDSNVFTAGGVAIKPALTTSLTDTSRTAGDGTYTGVTTTSSGSGTGLIVTVVVASNVITSCVATSPGSGYVIGEVITLTDGGEIT